MEAKVRYAAWVFYHRLTEPCYELLTGNVRHLIGSKFIGETFESDKLLNSDVDLEGTLSEGRVSNSVFP